MATASDSGTFEPGQMTGLHWIGVVFAVITGAIHLLLFSFQGATTMGLSFLFAGVVFLLAGAAVIFDFYRRPLYLLGIPFTAGQIVLWFVVNGVVGGQIVLAGLLSPISIVDKVAQVGLIAVLIVLYQRES